MSIIEYFAMRALVWLPLILFLLYLKWRSVNQQGPYEREYRLLKRFEEEMEQ